jgi:NTE family protein
MSSGTPLAQALWGRVQDWIRRLGRKPRIGLALGSGAAWGMAHIGVLSVFHELKISIAFLSGCSAGAFVGALYAGGLEGAALEACGRAYRWRDAGKLIIPPRMGLASNERMGIYLQKQIGNPRFEELRVPFFVVATDLTTGGERLFRSGPVIPAVRASCAIPGVFEPMEIDGELYADGSLVDQLPCEVLREAGADFVIGVALGHAAELRPANITEVISRSIDIALQCQAGPDQTAADLIIRPKLDGIGQFGFDRNDALIERGRAAALAELSQWSGIHA